jgi:hypothetical protein
MRCNQVSEVIDENAVCRLNAAERCAMQVHLASCLGCASAWRAHQSLLRQHIPPMPTHLLNLFMAVGANSPDRA